MIPTNSVSSVVKFVNVYAPLPGIQSGVQINDLPGVDSSNPRMDEITMATVNKLDCVLLVKRTNENPQLQPKEVAIMNRISGRVELPNRPGELTTGDFSRVVVVLSCQDDDWSTPSRGNEPLSARNAVRDLHNLYPSISTDRIHLVGGMNDYSRMSKSDPAYRRAIFSCQEVGSLLGLGQAVPLSMLDGFARFDGCINDLLNNQLSGLDKKDFGVLLSTEQGILHQVQGLFKRLSEYPMLQSADSGADGAAEELVYGDEDELGMLRSLAREIARHKSTNPNAPLLFQAGSRMSAAKEDFPNLCFLSPVASKGSQPAADGRRSREEDVRPPDGLCAERRGCAEGGRRLRYRIGQTAGVSAITFAQVEALYRSSLLKKIDPILKSIADFERENIISTIDTLILAIIRFEYRGGSLTALFPSNDEKSKPAMCGSCFCAGK